jgi:glycerophosphoryl diester phosphodiesterase
MKRLWFLGCLAFFSSCGVTMEIVAHRGASFLAPENTLIAANLAWELGADAVEVDVHLTHDRRIVAIHDENTLRTSGKDMLVAESRSGELRSLDVGSLKAKKYAGEKIPFLEEVLESLPRGKTLFVEVKCGTEILEPLKELLARSGKQGQVIVISFSYDVAVGFKKIQPRVPVHFLKSSKKDQHGACPAYREDLIAQALAGKLDGLGVNYRGITKGFAKAVRKAGLELYVWTVDDPFEANRLRDWGVDWLATNRPGWMRKQLEGE